MATAALGSAVSRIEADLMRRLAVRPGIVAAGWPVAVVAKRNHGHPSQRRLRILPVLGLGSMLLLSGSRTFAGGPDDTSASILVESFDSADPAGTAASAQPSFGQALRVGPGRAHRVADLGRREAMTIEFWVRLESGPASDLAALYASDGWREGLVHLNLKPDGAIELAVNGAGAQPTTEPGALSVGRWTQVVATCDAVAGRMAIYVGGRLAAEAAATVPPLELAPATVGAWRVDDGDVRPLDAAIDELTIFDRALTDGEVRRRFLAARGIEPRAVDFAAEVRPILEANCFDCHGPEMQESGLRLDVRASALLGGESGEPALVAFDAESSHLIRLITSTDGESAMPPGDERLTDAEVATLRDWIDGGAAWPDALAGSLPPREVESDHWSFQPVERPEPPVIPTSVIANPIDAFIASRLRSEGLDPSPEADRRTLIRRLNLDVRGLPPTPEEVDAFEADPRPDAWERLVDRALADPAFGERWATHWLDVIRYGDTHGFEVNTPRERAWPYRDYVIAALNDDLPFDRFVAEQLAGDRLGAEAATGFLVAAPALLQGQVGKDEPSIRLARADELHEVIVSVGAGLMGLTVGCARCHNHKFDPIAQRDYYAVQAALAGVRYGERPLSGPADAPAAFVGTFAQPPPTHRLYRGDPMQRRERIGPDVPPVLGSLALEPGAPEAERRLALARWLGEPDHPLTARVIVNRIWQHHFGTGLVATPSDFGAMGAAPSHPELLDWLAAELVDSGWSLKHVHRLILTSATYRQSSRPRSEALAVDAGDRLLWRFPPRRLDAEPLRDAILAASGELDRRMGGPGFLVFKPNDNYVRVYEARDDWGPEHARRMVYAHRVRMAQDGVFGAFDCPDAGQPAPRRGRSTTAIQALNLLNSTFVAGRAEALAARIATEVGDEPRKQVDRMFELAYGRGPSAAERATCVEAAGRHGADAVARALLNSNEFLFLP